MRVEANSPEAYISALPGDRKSAMDKLRNTIKDHLPPGYEETMYCGMITYAIPHTLYPPGYHVTPEDPLPLISMASQKNYIALYHMGMYMYPGLLSWFQDEYPKHVRTKLDMGKSCIRLKKVEDIPYDLIAELSGKLTVEQYIALYEGEKAKLKKK